MAFVKYQTAHHDWNLYKRNSKVAPMESYSFGSVPVVRSRTGYPLPGWRSIISQQGNATTTMSAVDNAVEIYPGAAFCTVKNGYLNTATNRFEDLDEWVTGAGLVPSSQLILQKIHPAKANNQALSRLYESIRNLRTHVSGGTFVGELGEALTQLRGIVKNIANRIPKHLESQRRMTVTYLGSFEVGPNGSAVRSRRNRDWWRKAPLPVKKAVSERLGDAWLGFAFGLKPLVSDIQSIAEGLARYAEHNVHTMARGHGSEAMNLPGISSSGAFYMHIYMKYVEVIHTSVDVVYRAKFDLGQYYDGPYARMKTLSEIFGFALEDFVPTVWNLLPYSFLLDYFVNVGDLLTAMTTDTSGFRWASKTVIYTTTKEVIAHAHNNGIPDAAVSGSLGGYKQITREIYREPVTQLPWPEVEIKVPEFATQYANMLALLSGGNRHARGY